MTAADATVATPTWRVGTMGFGYADWRGVFYPDDLKPGEYLSFYARHFDSVEIDSSFHADPGPARFARWAGAVPDGFRFTVKTPRAVTHESTLRDAVAPMRAFVASARALGDRLGCVLIQYPPTLAGRTWPQVARFFDALPGGVRYAVEFREPTWFRNEVYDGLRGRGIALVSAEYDAPPSEPIVTADFAYVRLIGRHGRYEPMNHERVDKADRLAWWRDRLTSNRAATVWCMINNDYAGFSIATADRMRHLVGQRVTTREERLGVLF